MQNDQVSTVDQRPDVHLLLAAPRGFCAGVRRAIDAVRNALARYGAPVYVRRAIVHNREVVRKLEREGAVFIEELAEAPLGSIVLFSAHGVAPALKNEAHSRGQIVFDAVCPLVAKIHREVERHVRLGRQIILIGHGGHPEIVGTLGHIPAGTAVLINCVEDVDNLAFESGLPLAYAIQTTYSVDDAAEIIAALRTRFSDLAGPPSSDICYATTNRQAAVRLIAQRADAMIVAGEHFSSNACRLAEVAAAGCRSVQLVPGADDLNWSLLPETGGVIGLTAAASTPESIVNDILAVLSDRFRLRVEQVDAAAEARVFKPLAIA